MRTKTSIFLAFVALLAVPVLLVADEKKTKDPTVVIRIQSLDGLVADAKYLAAQAGRADEAEQFEELFKSFTGEKGLEGLDTKKPMGIYGNLGPNIVDSDVVVLLPIADEKTFLATIKRLGVDAEKAKDGTWSFYPEQSPVPVFFRFANGYVYATARDKEVLDKDRIPAPEKVLDPKTIGTFSLSLNLADVPEEIRDLINGQVARQFGELKERAPGEPKEQHELKTKVLDQIAFDLKAFIEGAGKLTTKVDVNQKSEDVSLAFSLSAQNGSELAKQFANYQSRSSTVAGIIGDGSAIHGGMTIAIPKPFRKILDQVVDAGKKQALKEVEGREEAKYVEALLKALTPTMKMGEIDLAGTFIGPTKEGKYTILTGAKVAEGKGIEKLVKDVLKELPEEAKAAITVDVDKVGEVNIHRLNVGKELDGDAKEIFGESPVYFAVRNDAIFLALGPKAVDSIKSAITVKATKVIPIHGEMAVAGLAPLIEQEQKGAVQAAKKVFGKGAKGDRISFAITGGNKIEMRIAMATKLLRFFAEIEEARQAD